MSPLPDGKWVMRQTWDNLLFAHWPIPVGAIRDKVPLPLEVDTYDNCAWIGVVPFGMSRIRMRGLPSIPYTSSFPELNVRTYVTCKGRSGVYFFSLEAANRLAVAVARSLIHLPYYHAKITQTAEDGWIQYTSRRIHRNAQAADFQGKYRPVSEVFRSNKDTLEEWLTERYCLFTTHRNQVYRCDIHHPPWPLQHAEAQITQNTVPASRGLKLPVSDPLLHFAKKLDVHIWPLVKEQK